MAYTIEIRAEKNALLKVETSKLKSLNGTLKKYASFLKDYAFSRGRNFIDYITDDERLSAYWMIVINKDTGEEVLREPFSKFILEYFDQVEIYDMIKYFIESNLSKPYYLIDFIPFIKNGKIFEEVLGKYYSNILKLCKEID